MINMIFSWPLLASVTSNFIIPMLKNSCLFSNSKFSVLNSFWQLMGMLIRCSVLTRVSSWVPEPWKNLTWNPKFRSGSVQTFYGSGLFESGKVWEAQPSTITQLKAVVEAFFESLSIDSVKKYALNIKKWAQICIRQRGGHFEHLM